MTTQNPSHPDYAALERYEQRVPDSPALAPLVSELLRRGETARAHELCTRILGSHPDSPHLLLLAARAASHLGLSAELTGHLTRLRALLPLLYDQLIAGLAAEDEPRRRRGIAPGLDEELRLRRRRWSDEEHLIPEPDSPSGLVLIEPPPQPSRDEDLDLESLASRLEHAHVPSPMDDGDLTPESLEQGLPMSPRRPVTETLADIYARQGRIPEAIAAYEELAIRQPSQAALYMLRIQELRFQNPQER